MTVLPEEEAGVEDSDEDAEGSLLLEEDSTLPEPETTSLPDAELLEELVASEEDELELLTLEDEDDCAWMTVTT